MKVRRSQGPNPPFSANPFKVPALLAAEKGESSHLLTLALKTTRDGSTALMVEQLGLDSKDVAPVVR